MVDLKIQWIPSLVSEKDKEKTFYFNSASDRQKKGKRLEKDRKKL